MTNAIKCKCGFAHYGNPKMGNTIDIYVSWGILGRGDHKTTDNIYLNDNRCNTVAEDVDIKKIMWSGYYSQLLNETNRKSNYCTREKLKEKYLRYP